MSQPDSLLRPTIARGSLTAVQLSDREWRISDDRLPADDGRSVIGFVARTPGGFEVVELGDPVSYWMAPSLEAAFDKLAESASRQPGRVTYLSSYRRRRAGVPHAV
ncbi:hypothetical protein [Naasia sp. SYSU D00948]|uniref:hypothetical protein n=1 Tax=Naasia sp. SYSU D00948 TaxID=2817379 RepID=UPI001B3028E5|nr:hypothetical protein [Naasia sp. SYSU D00948]